MEKPIFISLSPNVEKDDLSLVERLILQPRKWKNGMATAQLEKSFRDYFKVSEAIAFNSGRSAFLAILRALDIKKGDEVLLQAFTCNAAVNPILKIGAKPVFIDIDESFNIQPEDLRKKITNKSKAIVVQHTFGVPAKMREIMTIAKENNLLVIEDVAHGLGSKYNGKFCGTFGDASFFSFGRDKIISSVFGGMAIAKNKNIVEKIRDYQREIDYPSHIWILQQLLHPILINYFVLPGFYLNSFLGKLLLVFFQKFKILSKAVYEKEKEGELANYFPKKLPNALALLACHQFEKLDRLNNHRKNMVAIYNSYGFDAQRINQDTEPVFMRFSVLVGNTDEKLETFRKKKIFLNDGWRKSSVVPKGTDLAKMNYLGDCKRAEDVANRIINLPTHINISEDQVVNIAKILRFYED